MKILILLTSLLGSNVLAGPTPVKEMPVNPNFQKIKQLVGKWEGTSKGSEGEQKINLTYEVTAGGSAVLERLFVGQPHEMISIYTQDGDKVMMTHYCMEKNQPTLQLKSMKDGTMKFEFVRGMAMDPKKDAHIHGLEMTFLDEDHLHQHWSGYRDGKPGKDYLDVTFTRSK